MGVWGAQLSFSFIFQKQRLVYSFFKVASCWSGHCRCGEQLFLLAALHGQGIFSFEFGATIPASLPFSPYHMTQWLSNLPGLVWEELREFEWGFVFMTHFH